MKHSSPVRCEVLLALAAAFALLVAGCSSKDEASEDTAASVGGSAGKVAAAPQSGSTPYPGMQGAKLVVPGDKAKKQ